MVNKGTYRLRRGESIYEKSDEIIWVYYLVTGLVRTSNCHPSKPKVLTFQIIQENNFFGYFEIFQNSRFRKNTATILSTKATIEKYSIWDFKTEVSKNFIFFEDLSTYMLQYQNRLWNRLQVMRNYHSFKKLGWMLLDMSFPINGDENKLEIQHYTHQILSEYTGSSRQSMTAALNDFRRLGIIEYNRGRILIDKTLMEKIILD